MEPEGSSARDLDAPITSLDVSASDEEAQSQRTSGPRNQTEETNPAVLNQTGVGTSTESGPPAPAAADNREPTLPVNESGLEIPRRLRTLANQGLSDPALDQLEELRAMMATMVERSGHQEESIRILTNLQIQQAQQVPQSVHQVTPPGTWQTPRPAGLASRGIEIDRTFPCRNLEYSLPNGTPGSFRPAMVPASTRPLVFSPAANTAAMGTHVAGPSSHVTFTTEAVHNSNRRHSTPSVVGSEPPPTNVSGPGSSSWLGASAFCFSLPGSSSDWGISTNRFRGRRRSKLQRRG